MSGLLPLIFILVIAETSSKAEPLHKHHALHTAWWWPMVLGLSVLVWLGIGELASRWVIRRGSWKIMAQTDVVLQGAILAWYAWICYGWGWSHYGTFTLSLMPWLLLQTAHWWSQAPSIQAISGHPWSRMGRVLYQWRFGVLPVVLILPFFDIGEWLSKFLDIEQFYNVSEPSGLVLMALSVQGFLLVVLALLPVLLIWLWGAKPLEKNEFTERMRGLCSTMNVQVAGLMRWPVPGGRVYNAAVIGLVPRFRYVLFTDDLVRDLTPNELTAVLGHELGHARYKHLWVYFLFATLVVLVVSLIQLPLAQYVRPFLAPPPLGILPLSPQDPWGSISLGISSLLLLAFMWRLLFGYVSRACERQADIAGAQLAGSPLIMASALKSVARLSGQPEDAASWRHHSIAERVAFMERVNAQPLLSDLHHRLVASMRNFLITLCCAILAYLVSEKLFSPAALAPRAPLEARQELAAWIDEDEDLGVALAAADRGNLLLYTTWINRASTFERERILRTLLIAIGDDTQEGYRLRHRLSPFISLTSGNKDLDREAENALAYFYVAGCAEPTVHDRATARELLPRLEEWTRLHSDHPISDTIGCVRYVDGDYNHAIEHFTTAIAALKNDRNAPATVGELYRKRLEAARTSLAGTPVPLPKDWPPPQSEASP